MKIQIELVPKHWWLEKADVARQPDAICRAHVRFESNDEKKIEVNKEELFTNIDDAVVWVKEQLG